MNVYPITFTDANGNVVTGELVTSVSLKNQFWSLVPSPDGNEYSGSATPPPVDTTPPTAPGALTLTVMSQTEIDLSWVASQDAVGVTGYLVERAAGTGPTYSFSQIATPAGITYPDTTLSSSTGYSYRVRATDAAGNLSAYSNIASGTTSSATPAVDTLAPVKPTGMTVSLGAGAVITFNPSNDPDEAGVWTGMLQGASPGAYNLQRKINAGSYADLATFVAISKGLQFTPDDNPIGAAASGDGITRTGASYTIAAYGVGTPSQGKAGVDIRAADPVVTDVSSPGSVHVFANGKVISGGVGDCMDYRSGQGLAATNTANTAAAASLPYKAVRRHGNVFTQYASADGSGLGQPSTIIGSVTVVLPATVWVGPAAGGSAYFGTADRGRFCSDPVTGDFLATWKLTTCTNDGALTSAQIDEFMITQDATISYADSTATTAGATYSYKANATDGAGNASPYSAAGAVTVASAGTNTWLSVIKSAIGTGKTWLGAFVDQYSSPGKSLDQFLIAGGAPATGVANNFCSLVGPSGQTAANITIQDHTGGVSTNTGKAPAILTIFPNTAGSAGTSIPASETLANAVAFANRGGLVRFNVEWPSPASGGFSGHNGEFGATNSVILAGTAYFNAIMYGAGRTIGNPNGGVWGLGQYLLSFLSQTGNKSFGLRIGHEGNLGSGSNWWGSGGVNTTVHPTNADYQVYCKQMIDYLRTILGPLAGKMYLEYNFNYFSGGYSQNDWGPAYRDLISGDLYGPDTAAAAQSAMTQGGFDYAQSLGIPVMLGEFGNHTFANGGSGSAFQFDLSVCKSLQAKISNLCAINLWDQMWAPSVQNNVAALMTTCLTLSDVPSYS